MSDHFDRVKQYVLDMDMVISKEDTEEELIIASDEDNGIQNLVIDCEETIVILEQVILQVPETTDPLYKRLLQMNRNLVHGSFCIDEDEKLVLFRDTLQLENLDRNELEGSIHALTLGLSEYGFEILTLIK